MRGIIIFLFAVVAGCLIQTETYAQRDAPVWSCYLSPISISMNDSNFRTKFVLHKDGGPHEHFEHQCYILMYLKTDETQILKSISNEDFVNKKNQTEVPFLSELERQGKVVQLKTKVAKRVSDENRDKDDCASGFCFPFEFDFDHKDLFGKLKSIPRFDVKDANVAGKATWFNQKFGLMVFVPVNDSIYSTSVANQLRETHDFASLMDSDTSILYFKPLPYDFAFKKHQEKLILYIN